MLKNEKQKATEKAASGLMNMAQQIIRNYQEDYGFADILERFLRKEFKNTATIPICKTPNVLALGGADLGLDIIINPKTIIKCMSKASKLHHGHDLDKDVFKYLVFELRNPVMLLKGSKDNTLVAVTDLKDRQNRPIIVTLALNRRNVHHLANQITSAYGRNNFNDYLRRQIDNGNLIAVNKNKANQMLQSAGQQSPIEETLISFDNSIAYSFENVNGFYQKNQKNSNLLSGDSYKQPDSKDISKLNQKLESLIEKFNEVLSAHQDIVEMIRFFDYAGDDIYNSILWHKFQQDKEFIKGNEVVSELEDILLEAQKTVDDFQVNMLSKDVEKDM